MPSGFGGLSTPQASLLSPYPAPKWADFVQMGNWQELGIVDQERAAGLTEKDIISWVLNCREESASARKVLEPYWIYYEDLYNLRTWDDDKQEWQSQIVVPEIRTKVRVILSMIQSGLLDAPEFFKTVNLGTPYDDEVVRFIQRLLDHHVQDSGFIDAMLGALEEGLLLGSGCAGLTIEDFVDRRPHIQEPSPEQMMQWQQMSMMAQMQGVQPPPPPQPFVEATPEQRSRFLWKMKTQWAMYPDPLGETFQNGKYAIEESEADEGDIEDRWRAGIYDSIDDIGEPQGARGIREYRQRRDSLDQVKRSPRRRHGIMEFTGTICDREGREVARNWNVTIINERTIVRCSPNPIWTGKSRYVWCTPLPHRGRVWGRSLIDADSHIQVALTNLLNLIIDDAKYSTLSAFVWNTSAADEPHAPDSIEPGKIYKAKDPSLLQKLQFGTNANAIWPVFNQLQDIGGKSTQISEWADGTPTSRGRPSAAEVKTKTAAGTSYVHNMTRDLERNVLEPALQLMYEAVVQFGSDTTDPKLSAMLQEYGGPQWFNDPLQRLQVLDKPFRIKVGGISLIMNRDTLMERVMQFIQTMQMTGMPLPPETMMSLPFIILTGLGLTPEQVHYPRTTQELQQMMMMIQMQQQAAMQQGGPGGPPGVPHGTAPGASPAHPGLPPPGSQIPPSPGMSPMAA